MHGSSVDLKRTLFKMSAHLNNAKIHLRPFLENLSDAELVKEIELDSYWSKIKLTTKPVRLNIELPAKKIVLELQFVGAVPTERNATLAAIQYYDVNGKLIDGPYEGCSLSNAVGQYIYLKTNLQGVVELKLNAPSQAKSIQVGLRLWSAKKSFYLSKKTKLRWLQNEDSMTNIRKAFWHLNSLSTSITKLYEAKINAGVTVLSAVDEISHTNLNGHYNLEKLDRKDYSTQIITENPAFVFLESAWKANGGDWEYAFLSPGLKHANAQAMVNAIEVAQSNNVPVVFWNKEDPLHYEKFLPIAQKADIILTTDHNCVDKYRAETKAKVDVMPFAANLSVTNSIGRHLEPNGTVCFAGGWYSVGHDERTRQMNYMLEPIREYNGIIYDRHSIHNNDRYAYPDRFKKHIKPAVSFDEMTKLYRRFKVFLNVNTIIDSDTMMSRRVYELLASGTPVVSAPSAAIEAQFSGIVRTATTASEANNAVDELIHNDILWRKTSHLGVREVLNKHQYKHRAEIINNIVYDKPTLKVSPFVSIIMSTKRQNFVDRIIENLSRQKGVDFEVHFALGADWTEENIQKLQSITKRNNFAKNITVSLHGGDELLGDKLNSLVKRSKGDFVSKFDDDDFYFDNYLTDIISSFELGDFDVVGKHSHPIYMESDNSLIWKAPNKRSIEHSHVSGATITARRRLFKTFPFASRGQGEDTSFLSTIKAAGGRIYSSDEFNFVQYRAASADQHTWRAEESFFRKMGDKVGTKENFRDWIV